jgi:large subunit ribosomal protein L15
MISLDKLTNSSRPHKRRKRVGRGIGSKRGKTSCRGEKGAGARAGYKRRYGKEGGNMPLYMKLPIRGFSNEQFRKPMDVVNLDQIEAAFAAGEEVNETTLRQKGFISGPSHGVKILGNGELKKKLKIIRVNAISKGAQEKLSHAKIHFEIIE